MSPEPEEKGCPLARLLSRRLEWVRGRREIPSRMMGGNPESEKKVPQRNDMGKMIKVLKRDKSSWDLTIRAAKTPKEEKTEADRKRARRKVMSIRV
jgi:hypothetical protein